MMTESLIRAAQMTGYGTPEVLNINRVPRPAPGRNEVLIRVHGSSVNQCVANKIIDFVINPRICKRGT